MKLRYDEEANAIYLRFSDQRIIESEEVRPGIVLDYDADGKVVAIEVLRSKLAPERTAREDSEAPDDFREPFEPQTPLVRSLLEARQRMADAGVPFIATWDDLEREIAERRGQPAHERTR